MNWLLEHFGFVVILAIAFASWVKRRMDQAVAERDEGRAREEMATDDGGEWRVPPAGPAPSVPPPLRRPVPPPVAEVARPPFQVEVSGIDEAVLNRQRKMQARLAEIKANRASSMSGGNVAPSWQGKPSGKVPMPGKSSLRETLKNPRQTRRAIVLREILGPPLGLR